LQRDFLQPLATNVIWLQQLRFATKLGKLQQIFIVAQGLEVSSGCPSHCFWLEKIGREQSFESFF
jgi:hypothetical protein